MRSTLAVLVLLVVALSLLPDHLGSTQAGDWFGLPSRSQRAGETGKHDFQQLIVPFLVRYCNSCHGGAKPKGELALDRYRSEADAIKDRQVWEKVSEHLRSRLMPPVGKPQPKPDEIVGITGWIDRELTRVDCTKPKDPGRVTIRRLNRAEYNNTIRDLVGVDFQPAEDFPSDDVGYGFDNIGDVLSLPPLLMEKYLAAAEKIVEKAWEQPETRQRILTADLTQGPPQDAARRIIGSFARRAYRRPVAADEIDRLMQFVDLAQRREKNIEKGIQLAATAILVSPHFLFRIELDREPNLPNGGWLISEYELASRLSYFLWSSMPDEELFRECRQNTLRKNLDAQVRRMLVDPKVRALTENFAGQWLQLRNLKTAAPDPKLFAWNDQLRADMQKETELFFEAIIREDRSILDFIDADFTFVNERLAKHYGIPDIQGNEFRRLQLAGGQRGGVLTHASVLTVTSNPTRTSPVKRGKFILENILGTPPPPPPPDVPELSEDSKIIASASLRKRLEEHRANPNCAICHQRMDTLGLAFENFDAVGKWRTRDGKFDIDPSGTLPDGQSFKGVAELKQILKKQADLFTRCFSEKLLTYALGRGLEYYDKCAVDEIVNRTSKGDFRFLTAVQAVVHSDPFQMRRPRRESQ